LLPAPVDLLDLVVVCRFVREALDDRLDERFLVVVPDVTQEFVGRLRPEVAEFGRQRTNRLVAEVTRKDDGFVPESRQSLEAIE